MRIVAIAMAKMRIQQLIDSAGGEHGRIVSAVDQVVDILIELKLAYRLRIPPKMVGVHPANRGGYGISASEIHSLGEEIVEMGWSWGACSHAICIEDDEDMTISKYTCSLKDGHDGLQQSDPAEIKFGPLSCTHTNQFLCCVLAGVVSDIESLCLFGRVSEAKVCSDIELMKALKDGLEWTVIKAGVAKEYPSLPELIQAARNKPGQSQRSDNEFQAIQRVWCLMKRMSTTTAGGVTVDWERVQKAVSATNRCKDIGDIPVFTRFVQLWGGGEEGQFVADLNRFHQLFVPAGRTVPTSTFKSLCDLKLGPSELMPHMVTAIVKTQASCPASKVQENVCRFISPADIAGIEKSTTKSKFLEGEKVLREFRKLASTVGLNDPDRVKFFGRLDTTVVRFLFTKPLVVKHPDLQDIVKFFKCDLAKLVPSHSGMILPASAVATATAPTVPFSEGTAPNVMQYKDGVAIDAHIGTLKNLGFVVGSVVKTADGTERTISKISGDGSITLGGQKKQIQFDVFCGTYSIVKGVMDFVDDWVSKDPSHNSGYTEFITKAQISMALSTVYNDIPLNTDLRLQMKPSRTVIAGINFAVGKLVLVPVSQRIIKSSEVPAGGFECKVSGTDKYYVTPMFVPTDFVVPAWIVKTTEDADEANMDVCYKQVTVTSTYNRGSSKVVVQVPILVNKVPVKKDVELMYFREAPAKKEKRQATVMAASTAQKKQKK